MANSVSERVDRAALGLLSTPGQRRVLVEADDDMDRADGARYDRWPD
jgi:hypothetical protein